MLIGENEQPSVYAGLGDGRSSRTQVASVPKYVRFPFVAIIVVFCVGTGMFRLCGGSFLIGRATGSDEPFSSRSYLAPVGSKGPGIYWGGESALPGHCARFTSPDEPCSGW